MKLFVSNRSVVDSVTFEKQFVIPLTVAGMVFAIIAIFINLGLNFGVVLEVIPYVALAIFAGLYFIAKIGKGLQIVKWVLVFVTLTFLNLLWYYNFGTHGPTLYLFVLAFSYLVFMLDGKQLVITAFILIINISTLFYLEYNNPALVGNYPTSAARIVDVYVGIFLYLFLMFIIMNGAKKIYIYEFLKAREADQLKSSFLANMSHEIRTPLNAIVGFSNLLADDDVNESDRKDYVSIINSSNRSLLRLIDDILDVSLMETNQLKLVYKDCDLQQMMNDLETTYKHKRIELNKVNLAIRKEGPLAALVLHTDCERLRQVFVNLLDNAIKYTEQGSIVFGYAHQGNKLRFYVKDTGIGVSEHHKEHLFDRFYKVEDSTDKLFRGTGIGLYLCKNIVKLLGGDIGVISEVNKGSEFYFSLPAKIVSREETPIADHPILSDSPKSRKLKILVVEDQLSNRQYLEAILKSSEYELIHAVNGLEGVEKFKANPDVDLILMDIKMPEMDGFEALKEIRKLNTKVPVFALTAHALVSDRDRCLKAGFNAYFPKPLDKVLLFSEIEEWCKQ